MVKVLERIQDIEEVLHDLIASSDREANILKEILHDWNIIANSDLDNMVTCEVVSFCEMLYKYHGLMGLQGRNTKKTCDKITGSLRRLLGN